jgi:hypothetical protein
MRVDLLGTGKVSTFYGGALSRIQVITTTIAAIVM